ncbi:hypothetical protein CLU79DRAFT_693882 [Phycomyces nitens]|nr:hypothetical protein CLU79DRAFT_693882 [Phycomyces nitens]
MEIIQVTQDLILQTKITREMAVIKFFKWDLAINEYKFAKPVAELARKLPRVSLAEELNEMKLCSWYIDPFLSSLFDEPDKGISNGTAKNIHFHSEIFQ